MLLLDIDSTYEFCTSEFVGDFNVCIFILFRIKILRATHTEWRPQMAMHTEFDAVLSRVE